MEKEIRIEIREEFRDGVTHGKKYYIFHRDDLEMILEIGEIYQLRKEIDRTCE